MAGAEDRGPRTWPVDLLHYAFFALILCVTLLAFEHIPDATWWAGFDFAAVFALAFVERLSSKMGSRGGAILRLVHGILVVPVVFTQVGVVIGALRAADHAPILEQIDRWMFFGTNPIEWLEHVSHPVLTEIMQWAYTAYLLLPVGLVVLLAWRGTAPVVSRSLFVLLGVMYLSYIGYFLVPAAGPNIHSDLGPLHPVSIPLLRLYRFSSDLPGVWMTAQLRAWMFDVEWTKKDCFPSGHVAVAVVCFFLARAVDRRLAPLFGVIGAGVILSTMYLRYHYVVDVVAGVLLAWFALTWWARLHDRLLSQSGRS